MKTKQTVDLGKCWRIEVKRVDTNKLRRSRCLDGMAKFHLSSRRWWLKSSPWLWSEIWCSFCVCWRRRAKSRQSWIQKFLFWKGSSLTTWQRFHLEGGWSLRSWRHLYVAEHNSKDCSVAVTAVWLAPLCNALHLCDTVVQTKVKAAWLVTFPPWLNLV